MYLSNLMKFAAQGYGIIDQPIVSMNTLGVVTLGNGENNLRLGVHHDKLSCNAPTQVKKLLEQWNNENKRAIFLWQNLENMVGLVHDELLNDTCEELEKEHLRIPSKSRHCGLEIKWAYALACHEAKHRYALQCITITPTALQLSINGRKHDVSFPLSCTAHINDKESERYLHLFVRDNSEWLTAWCNSGNPYRMEKLEGSL